MITAITRGVGPSMGDCELTYLSRQTIDSGKAERQQRTYEQSLQNLGVRLVSLPHADGMPDGTFVQDTAVVVKEVAVIARMGAATRRKEVEAVQAALSPLRELKFINHDGTLEGGDVIRIGRTFFVGVSRRTNRAGIAQLRSILEPFDYQVREVEVRGCLHLTTACSYLGRDTLLVNRAWVDVSPFERLELLDIPDAEPFAANTILIGDTVLMADHYPLSRVLLESRGFRVQAIDISELEKAEAGLSCLSLLFED